MSGRANCNPHRFQPSMGETRTTRALSLRIRNHSRTEDGPADRVTTHDTMVRVGKKRRCGVFASKKTHADRSPKGIPPRCKRNPGFATLSCCCQEACGLEIFCEANTQD